MEKEEGELCRTVVVAFDVTFSQWESRFNSSSIPKTANNSLKGHHFEQ